MSDIFQENLIMGQAGENVVARYLIYERGFSMLPVYQVLQGNYKGPRFYTKCGEKVAPDALGFKGGSVFWFEIKTKTRFSWYRKTKTWQTGIDRSHYHDYLDISTMHPFPLWLLFFHTQHETHEGDGKCPVGLYGNDIQELSKCVAHEYTKNTPAQYGKCGMVYWNQASLKPIATIEEIMKHEKKEVRS